MLFLKLFGAQLTLTLAVLKLVTALDREHGLRADRAAGGILLAGCCLGAAHITSLCGSQQPMLWPGYLVLAVYLTVCSITDFQTCKVYDILQVPAAVAGAILCLLQEPLPGGGSGLVLFALLQYLLFMRFYGEGDVMAFQICSLYLVGKGGDLQTLLLHMALAFTLLGAVQALRRNINQKGNLKVPVPFLPYIACSLLWFL